MNKKIIILIGLILILVGASLLSWERAEQQKGNQLIQKQQEHFQLSLQKLDQIVSDQSDIKSTKGIITDQKLESQIEKFKSDKEMRELCKTVSILTIVAGSVIICGLFLLKTYVILINRYPALGEFTSKMLGRSDKNDNESLPDPSVLALLNEPENDIKPAEEEFHRTRKHSKVLSNSGWQNLRSGSATEVEMLLSHKQSDQNSVSDSPGPSDKVEDSNKTTESPLEQECEKAEAVTCKKPETDIFEPAEPVNKTLDELSQHVAAIREYASSQQDRVEKLQDGYDWNILRTFCLRIIRSIDNIEYRIESLSEQNIDTSSLEEIRDELIFSLESSGVEPFEPEPYSEYRGQEKNAEAVKDKERSNDPDLKGKIARVLRRGYRYVIADDNYKIVRAAQVKLFG
ncbi:MAG: nucleotide exchange factor GrpE [Planctomycetota bacterium]|jgi:molecular chaperone GrpE (heat shock protein)